MSICAGSVNNMMSGDFDEEGLLAFNEIAKETMKIERLVIQQQELSSKLEELLETTQIKEEKERESQKYLQNDIRSCAAKHNLLKENLQGKKSSRHMVEQMTSDLERQLHLEQNNIHNKVTAFEQTERKYTDMWSQYEAVYLGSEEAQCMLELQTVSGNAVQHLQQLSQVIQSLKDEYQTKMRQRDNKRNALVLQLAELTKEHQKVRFEKEVEEQEFKLANEELTNEKNNVMNLQAQLAAGVATNVTQGKVADISNDQGAKQTGLSFRDRLKNIFQFDALTLPELELPAWDLLMPNEPEEPEDFGTNYQVDTDGDIEEMDTNPYIVANRDVTFQTPVELQAQIPATPEVMDTQESAIVEPQEEPLVMADEPSETPTDTQNTDQITEQSEEQISDSQPEPMSHSAPEDEAPQDTETEERDEEVLEQYSQELLLPTDSQETASQAGSSCSSVLTPNMEPHFSSAVSEGSDTSSLDLLNDERRHAYLKKLMASPEFPVAERGHMTNSFFNAQQQQQNRSPENPDYLNNLHQMFHESQSDNISGPPDVNSQSDEEFETSQNQQIMQGMQEESLNGSEETVSYDGDQSTAASFTNMNSLFGPDPAQTNSSNNESAFSFGGFPFGGATTTSGSTDFFGGSNLFGNSAPAQMETSPFGTSTPMQTGSDAFNLNFNDNSDSNSIFKLF